MESGIPRRMCLVSYISSPLLVGLLRAGRRMSLKSLTAEGTFSIGLQVLGLLDNVGLFVVMDF